MAKGDEIGGESSRTWNLKEKISLSLSKSTEEETLWYVTKYCFLSTLSYDDS